MRKTTTLVLLVSLLFLTVFTLIGCSFFSSSSVLNPSLPPAGFPVSNNSLNLSKGIFTIKDSSNSKGVVLQSVSPDFSRKVLFIGGTYGPGQDALFIRAKVSNGNVRIDWAVTGSIGVFANDVHANSEGYYATGVGLNGEFYVTMLNPDDGTVRWVKRIYNDYGIGMSLIDMPDNSVIAGGWSDNKGLIAKISYSGLNLWAKSYYLVSAPDPDMVINPVALAYTDSHNLLGVAAKDVFLLLNPSNGTVVKALNYSNMSFYKVVPDSDGFILLGEDSTDNYMVIAKVDFNGNPIWAKKIQVVSSFLGAEIHDGKLYLNIANLASPRAYGKLTASSAHILVVNPSDGSIMASKELPNIFMFSLYTGLENNLRVINDNLVLAFADGSSPAAGMLTVYPLDLNDSDYCWTMGNVTFTVNSLSLTVNDLTSNVSSEDIPVTAESITTDPVSLTGVDWCTLPHD